MPMDGINVGARLLGSDDLPVMPSIGIRNKTSRGRPKSSINRDPPGL
jgi:hypothetical protein